MIRLNLTVVTTTTNALCEVDKHGDEKRMEACERVAETCRRKISVLHERAFTEMRSSNCFA